MSEKCLIKDEKTGEIFLSEKEVLDYIASGEYDDTLLTTGDKEMLRKSVNHVFDVIEETTKQRKTKIKMTVQEFVDGVKNVNENIRHIF